VEIAAEGLAPDALPGLAAEVAAAARSVSR
jgi:hypothetical protein